MMKGGVLEIMAECLDSNKHLEVLGVLGNKSAYLDVM